MSCPAWTVWPKTWTMCRDQAGSSESGAEECSAGHSFKLSLMSGVREQVGDSIALISQVPLYTENVWLSIGFEMNIQNVHCELISHTFSLKHTHLTFGHTRFCQVPGEILNFSCDLKVLLRYSFHFIYFSDPLGALDLIVSPVESFLRTEAFGLKLDNSRG